MSSHRIPDYIVVGAGAAGAVVAARLSEDPHVKVLLLEAGGKPRGPLFNVPLMTGLLLRSSIATWPYLTEPEPQLNGRRLKWPRGKVLGGSTSINGMVWRRGLPIDFDLWAQSGLSDWSWEKVELWFRRAERIADHGDSALGSDGAMALSRGKLSSPLFDAWYAAARARGLNVDIDTNAPDVNEGVGRYDFAIRDGRRISTKRAYLDPARARPNLDVMTNARVVRLTRAGRRITGVDVHTPNGETTVQAAREVILCGGTVNSPHLLLLSGIGPADQLRSHGIDIAADVPGVGQGLQDHLLVRVEYQATQPVTIDRLRRIDHAALALSRAMLFGTGPAATFPIEVGGFFKSDPSLELPDLQFAIMPGLSSAALRIPGLGKLLAPDRGNGFFANIFQMRPNSRGELRLASADPFALPSIRPNYLSAAPDRDVLRSGVKILRDLFADVSFDPYRGAELSPGKDVKTDADLDKWIAATADTVFHPTSSCRMGTDRDSLAVVDPAFRVRGVEGLRIVDASVMPSVTSGNTMAPVIMIAERAAHLMRGGAPYPAEPLAHV